MEADYLVLGSGPAAVMAALTLLGQGKSVSLLDAGLPQSSGAELPHGSFQDWQAKEQDQWKLLLGERYEALQTGEVSTAAHLSAGRRYVNEGVSDWMPVSGDLTPLESLSRGGLGQAWGLGSFAYSEAELKACGLPGKEMQEAYNVVSRRIGISAGNDDLRHWLLPGISDVLPPLKSDRLISSLHNTYSKHQNAFHKKGVILGSPTMALLTEPYNGRPALSYDELEFYRDDDSAYRPEISLREMKANPRFRHLSGWIALSFREDNNGVLLELRNRDNCSGGQIRAGKLLLAASTLSTARIVMRSLNIPSLPLLCNPYQYLVSLSPQFLGRNPEARRSALAQAMMLIRHPKDESRNSVVSLYTYGSLLQYRLLREIPILPLREAQRLARFASPALVIAGIHHPEAGAAAKCISLHPDPKSLSGDRLHITYEQQAAEVQEITGVNRRLRHALRQLGLIPLKLLDPGMGASIHYAGSLPFADEHGRGRLQGDGKLIGTDNVWVADASGFRFLPAKGITLSIMANAHRIAATFA
jgi:hypothetical protein